MNKSKPIHNINKVKEMQEMNDYEYTCHTIIAINNIISFNLGGKCYQGPTMRTSSTNAIQPDRDVTPDMSIEVPATDGKPQYFALNEIKVDLPKEEEYRYEIAEQLKKYDDNLSGWKKSTPNTHDIMFTTNQMRTLAFHQYMNKLSAEGRIVIQRPFAILHSTPMRQTDSFIVIRKDYGNITNTFLDNKLSNGIAVNEYNIVREFDQMKFCDYKPPLVYMMMVIWDHVLKTFLSPEQLRELKGNKIILVDVTISEVHARLSAFAPDTNPNCIETGWVGEALQAFVDINAGKVLPGLGNFQIKFRQHGDKLRDWIFESIANPDMNESASLDEYL